MLNRLSTVVFIMVFLLLFSATASHAGSHGWLIYYEGSFRGKVIDSETKEPIESAIVVAIYHVRTFGPILPIFSDSQVADVYEVITDSKGEFLIPSNIFFYPLPTTMGGEYTSFIIFKPGYGSYPNYHVSPPKVGINPEDFFSRGKVGEEGEMVWKGIGTKTKVTFGVVELPRLRTREERIKASMIGVTGYHKKDLPRLYKAINEEERYLGIPERE